MQFIISKGQSMTISLLSYKQLLLLIIFLMLSIGLWGCSDTTKIEKHDLVGCWTITKESLMDSAPPKSKYSVNKDRDYSIIFYEDGSCDFNSVIWSQEYHYIKTKGKWEILYNIEDDDNGKKLKSMIRVLINENSEEKFTSQKCHYLLKLRPSINNGIYYIWTYSYEAEYGFKFKYVKQNPMDANVPPHPPEGKRGR